MNAGEFDKRFDEGEDISPYLDVSKAEAKNTRIDENFGLRPEALELIRDIFRRHLEVHRVEVSGSRALGRFEDQSDIDLALWGDLDPRPDRAEHARTRRVAVALYF